MKGRGGEELSTELSAALERIFWAEKMEQVGKHYIVDATSKEESQMSSIVSISINRHGQIFGLTKREVLA